MPSWLPPTQTLLSWSKTQPWMEFGTTLGSPQDAMTLPARSNMMMGGACCAVSAFFGGDIAAIDDHNVIMRIGTDTSQLAGDPAFRKRFGPGGIDFEARNGLGGHH